MYFGKFQMICHFISLVSVFYQPLFHEVQLCEVYTSISAEDQSSSIRIIFVLLDVSQIITLRSRSLNLAGRPSLGRFIIFSFPNHGFNGKFRALGYFSNPVLVCTSPQLCLWPVWRSSLVFMMSLASLALNCSVVLDLCRFFIGCYHNRFILKNLRTKDNSSHMRWNKNNINKKHNNEAALKKQTK